MAGGQSRRRVAMATALINDWRTQPQRRRHTPAPILYSAHNEPPLEEKTIIELTPESTTASASSRKILSPLNSTDATLNEHATSATNVPNDRIEIGNLNPHRFKKDNNDAT